jgi:hypothetical protein
MAEHPETGKWTFFVGGFKPLREGKDFPVS